MDVTSAQVFADLEVQDLYDVNGGSVKVTAGGATVVALVTGAASWVADQFGFERTSNVLGLVSGAAAGVAVWCTLFPAL